MGILKLFDEIERVIFTQEQIKKRVKELGEKITEDYSECKCLTMIGILKGSCVFLADLIRNINLHTELEFITASSYKNASRSSGTVTIQSESEIDIEGKDIIIIEDIIDTGITLNFIKELFEKKGPNSLRIGTLLDKPARRQTDITADYVGFTDVPDEFVVGYGLDYAGKYRNLSYIGSLKKEIYE